MLRNQGVAIERGGERLYLAGVDDTWTGRDDLDETLAARPAGVATVLLAHDPALFPDAAARGVELTLSGHTHGGQLGVPFFARRWNLARVMTRFASGFYREGALDAVREPRPRDDRPPDPLAGRAGDRRADAPARLEGPALPALAPRGEAALRSSTTWPGAATATSAS